MRTASAQAGVPLFLGIPLIWYRDNCPCPQCRDPKSGQKLFQITELSKGLALKSVEETADTITVSFAPDDHRSVFSREWLFAKADAERSDWRSEAGKKLWLASEIGDRLPVTSWNLYKSNDAERLRLLREIDALGFAIVRKAPRDEGTVLEIAKTFGYVRETNYGALFDVRVELTPSNLAFTGLAIGPHTDNPYRDPVPTMQLLHCLSNAVDGGESGLVDGFKAAALLRAEDPAAFAVLTATLVPFAWSDARAVLRAVRPLIQIPTPPGAFAGFVSTTGRCRPSVSPVRHWWSSTARTGPSAEVIARRELQLRFRLEPGDCVIFDNTRLLHARTAFKDGAGKGRHLQGCYADLDGLLSTIAVLEGVV